MKKIIYPKVFGQGKTIGVTAPSSGLGLPVFIDRFELVKKEHEKRGYSIVEGKCLRQDRKFVSASKNDRALDLMELLKDSQIDLIHPPWGGELLIDILELLDYEFIQGHPKWIQGYSDVSTLLFTITLKTGVATAHGTNFMDFLFGQDELTLSSRNYLSLSEGEIFVQTSSQKWQKNFVNFSEKIDTLYNCTENTHWKLLSGDHVQFSGRIIGGCIDTIRHLIGTPYGNIPQFAADYAPSDGVILYLENCDQDPTEMYRTLLSMKYAGWFDQVKGLVFGRNNGPDDKDFSYLESIEMVLKEERFPIVIDADIGHKPPQMTILNGSFANFEIENGAAVLSQKLI